MDISKLFSKVYFNISTKSNDLLGFGSGPYPMLFRSLTWIDYILTIANDNEGSIREFSCTLYLQGKG